MPSSSASTEQDGSIPASRQQCFGDGSWTKYQIKIVFSGIQFFSSSKDKEAAVYCDTVGR